MSSAVGDHIQLSKRALFDRSGEGFLAQTGGEVIDNFALREIDRSLIDALPSIETFVLSLDRACTATGSNDALIAAWMPSVERLGEVVLGWAAGQGIELVGDTYITASVTVATEVNGEAHFDDDQFDPDAGAGLVAIVGDLAGSSVAGKPIPHAEIRPHQPVTASEELDQSFAGGGFGRVDYGAGELVVLPQFGQLHSGPGPCGTADEVRHLMVLRAATRPLS